MRVVARRSGPSGPTADDAALVEPWMTEETRELARAFASLRDEREALRFLRDVCTIRELQELSQRLHVARLVDAGVAYHEISRRTGASSATISRVAQWLHYGRGGYRRVIDRLTRRRRRTAVDR